MPTLLTTKPQQVESRVAARQKPNYLGTILAILVCSLPSILLLSFVPPMLNYGDSATLLTGKLSELVPHWSPLYPLFLHSITSLFGFTNLSIYAILAVQHVLTISAAVYFSTAFSGTSRRVTMAAFAVMANYFFVLSHGIYTEALSAAALFVFLGAVTRLATTPDQELNLLSGFTAKRTALILISCVSLILSVFCNGSLQFGRSSAALIHSLPWDFMPANEKVELLGKMTRACKDDFSKAALSSMVNNPDPAAAYAQVKKFEPFFAGRKTADQAMNDAAKAFFLTPNKYLAEQAIKGFSLCMGEGYWVNWAGLKGGGLRCFQSFIEASAASSTLYRTDRSIDPKLASIPIIRNAQPEQYYRIAEVINPAVFDGICHYLPLGILAILVCLHGVAVGSSSGRSLKLVLSLGALAVLYAAISATFTVVVPRMLLPVNMIVWTMLAIAFLARSYSRSADSKPLSMKAAIAFYMASFFIPILAASLSLFFTDTHDEASLLLTPIEKEQWFRRFGSTCDLVFVGDSRTWNGIHPDIMDKYLGTNSVNLAAPAHWFVTQYPYYQDLVKSIPPGSTVVWSFGHGNFTPGQVQNSYPIKIKDVPALLSYGFTFDEIRSNLLHFNPLTQLLDRKGEMRNQLTAFTDADLWTIGANKAPENKANRSESSKDEADDNNLVAAAPKKDSALKPEALAALRQKEKELTEYYRRDPHVAKVEFPEEEGAIRSVVLKRDRGSYYRVLLDPAFFARKQAEHRHKMEMNPHDNFKFEPSPRYWRLFESIVKVFKDNHINLIVNEIQEAPNNYGDQNQHDVCEQFMRTKVASYVRSQGFQYISVDFSKFKDDDYFDYNHLNSKGSQRYDKMLADLLRPLLKGGAK